MHLSVLALVLSTACFAQDLPWFRRAQGTNAPPVVCSTPQVYLKTDTRIVYVCFPGEAYVPLVSRMLVETTIPYTDSIFLTANTIVSKTLLTLPAHATIVKVRWKPSVAFAGTGVTGATLNVGTASNAARYSAYPFDLVAAVSALNKYDDGGSASETDDAHGVIATFTANTNWGTGAATVLTAGSVLIRIYYEVQP